MIVQGVRWVITVLTIVIALTALAASTSTLPLAIHHQRIQTWARNYPFYALALLFLLGAVIARLFLNSNA